MASTYIHESLKVVVAQICQVIGYQGINSTPLEVVIDLLHRYLIRIATLTHSYSEHCGRTEPIVEDLELAFNDLGVSVADLEEYVNHVDSIPFPHQVPKLPVPRPSNLNFLKPGSQEILSRPIHIHEHLPPMYPEKEEEELQLRMADNMDDDGPDNELSPGPYSPGYFKRPNDDDSSSPSKRYKHDMEDEGEPVREIQSVMMTTSGFISSSREGKMPEGRRPNISSPLLQNVSPTTRTRDSLMKKKVTMEKIIRHKTHLGGIQPGPLAKPRPKDFRLKPKLPSAPPGTGSLKASGTSVKVAPKLKIPTPKTKHEGDAVPDKSPTIKSSDKDGERKRKRDKDKPKDEQRHKDRKRDRENKKDRESRRKVKLGRDKDDLLRDIKREEHRREKDIIKKDRIRLRMRGLSKEEELQRYKEREKELIAALAASSAVTVTSIPPPPLRVREKTPDSDSSPDSKRKLSIFKKFKIKELKDSDKISRDSSPDLMINVQNIKEEKLDSPPEEELPPAPMDDFGSFSEGLSPPVTPRTTEVHMTFGQRLLFSETPEKKRVKEKGKMGGHSKSRTKSPKGLKKAQRVSFSSPHEEIQQTLATTPDRPKTPDGGTALGDLAGPPLTSLLLPSFPNNPSFIPPFKSFNYNTGFDDERAPPEFHPLAQIYGSSPGNNRLPLDRDEHGESLERPVTPCQISGTSDTTPSRNLEESFSKDPVIPDIQKDVPVTSKPEKKKEHKKDRKTKEKDVEKDKEKLKRKKDKKDREKAKEEKKKEKERLKQEKKEKRKVKRAKEESNSVPKITLKIQTEESMTKPQPNILAGEVKPPTKLVIKPVVKRPEENLDRSHSLISPPAYIPPEDEPGSPTIAKFSALITHPPKSSSLKKSPKIPTVPPLKIKDASGKKSEKKEKKKKLTILTPPPDPNISAMPTTGPFSPPKSTVPEPVRSTPKGSRKFSPSSSSGSTPAKPTTGLLTETVGPIGHFVDDQGNEVWICPTCGKQDDGSPMIGCDTCDDWYHWLCVGIQIPPNDTENWYCPRCVSQRQLKGIGVQKKKRGRKKKIL